MSDIWLGTMNNIVNYYNKVWDRYPLGSRAMHEVIGIVADKFNLSPKIIEEVIYDYEYGYIDADDVDLGEKLGIDNPEWEHKPEAFLMFRAVHQSWAYNNCLTYEQPMLYDV